MYQRIGIEMKEYCGVECKTEFYNKGQYYATILQGQNLQEKLHWKWTPMGIQQMKRITFLQITSIHSRVYYSLEFL